MPKEYDEVLKNFAKDIPGVVFHYTVHPDRPDMIKLLNENAIDVWGVSSDEVEDNPDKIWEMIHKCDLKAMRASIAKSTEEMASWEFRWRTFDKMNSKKWLYGRGTPTALPDGSIRWLTFVFDITSEIQAATEAAKAMDGLTIAMEAVPDGFAIFDEHERLITCNHPYRDIYKKSQFSLVKGASFESILRAGLKAGQFMVDDVHKSAWLTERMRNFHRATVVEEVQLYDGTWLRVFERPTGNGGRAAFCVDITHAKERETELENAVLTDPLTGLLNRRGLNKKISALPGAMPPAHRAAFLHIDLDKFKTINDGYGSDAGDYILTKISNKLRQLAGTDTCLARGGGDEFIALIPNAPSEIEAFRFAERLRSIITSPIKYKGRVCQIGASIGISFWYPNASYAIEQALLDAETALMRSKSAGRNRSIIFREEMRAQALKTACHANEIKTGLQSDQFVPFFQPQIEWPGQQLCGFEAMARWVHAGGKTESASCFIEDAIDTGLIVDIDKVMITRRFEALEKLTRAGLTTQSLSMNLSSAFLRSPELLDTITSQARSHAIEHNRIHIEIVEASLVDDRSKAITKNVSALSAAGFKIDLDDFGTGHTAITNLRQFPVQRIKIDRSLIHSIETDQSLRAITEGIYGLCCKMGIDAIASGIETQKELRLLSEIGLSVFQGYHLGHPMSFGDLIQWLQEQSFLEAATPQSKIS
ncbi:MAG: EAL domain-containing protein [Roseobacter sp.]